jgi:hypothetical protein
MPAMHRRSLFQAIVATIGALVSNLLLRRGHAQSMMPDMGGMMGGGMGGMMGPMRTGMQLFNNHAKVHRQVTVLSDGVRAVTESDDPHVAALIQEHVSDMYARIDRDQPFAYPMSRTVPALFRNIGRYHRTLEITSKGVAVTETASDVDMIELIKAHAREITGFVDKGMPAMMGDMMR